jgi:hypothetical protein
MSNSIHSVQSANAQTQTDQTVQAPKKPQAATQAQVQGDTVTVSKAAQKALSSNAKPASRGDVNHDGDSR